MEATVSVLACLGYHCYHLTQVAANLAKCFTKDKPRLEQLQGFGASTGKHPAHSRRSIFWLSFFVLLNVLNEAIDQALVGLRVFERLASNNFKAPLKSAPIVSFGPGL